MHRFDELRQKIEKRLGRWDQELTGKPYSTLSRLAIERLEARAEELRWVLNEMNQMVDQA